jgi:hypothetical protein
MTSHRKLKASREISNLIEQLSGGIGIEEGVHKSLELRRREQPDNVSHFFC